MFLDSTTMRIIILLTLAMLISTMHSLPLINKCSPDCDFKETISLSKADVIPENRVKRQDWKVNLPVQNPNAADESEIRV